MPLTPQVTVTGNLQQITGTLDAASAKFELEGFGPTIPRVSGTAVIVQTATLATADGSGNISVTLWGLDVITPSGCFYNVTFYNDTGGFVASLPYNAFVGSATYDLSQAVPMGQIVVAAAAPNAAIPQVFSPVAHNFLTGMNSSGVFINAQPAFNDLTGIIAPTQLPTPAATTLGGIKSLAAVSNKFLTSIGTDGGPVAAQPAFTDISGTIAASQLPNPSATTLGGVKSLAAVSHQFLTGISTGGVPSAAQPTFSDIASGPIAATVGAFTDIVTVTGSASLPTGTGSTVRWAGGFASPVSGRLFIGDGTGWQLLFSKRITSVTTDLFTFQDNGNMSLIGQYLVNGTQIAAANLLNGVTGSGAIVLVTSPTLVTPVIGAATATSINKVAITAPATSATLTIANGKTLTANNSLTLAGTDATTLTFQGTDTYVGRATTDTLTNKTVGAGGLGGLTVSKQIFTSSGTFTIPTGVTSVKIFVTGAGGAGGGGTATAGNSGRSGGSGATAIKWLTGLTPGNTLTVTVGTGGTVGTAGTNPGNAGSASSVASGTQTISTITGNGGIGGPTNATVFATAANDATASGGDVNLKGVQDVMMQYVSVATGDLSSYGAPSYWGHGGAPAFNGAGNAGVNPGSGGSGAGGGAAGNVAGGAGANGIVIFEWMI